MEEWKPIKDYEGLYEVSNLGRVKSLNYKRTGKEKILKNIECRNGYLAVSLTKLGKQKVFYIHKLVAEAFIPNPDNLPQVNHIDGNKKNNKVSNLEWCDNAYNQKHAWDNNLQSIRHARNCKLSQEQADFIRQEYLNGSSISELSTFYQVSKTTIKDILNGKHYNLDKDILSVTKEQTKRKLTFEQAEEIRKACVAIVNERLEKKQSLYAPDEPAKDVSSKIKNLADEIHW